jgi:hypothetical protein
VLKFQINTALEHLDAKTIIRHPHGTFEVFMGPLRMQNITHYSYRTCPRHPVKNIDLVAEDLYDGKMGCGCCGERKFSCSILEVERQLTNGSFHQRPEDLLL